MRAAESPVKSAERVLSLLEFFDRIERSATVTEIAKGLGTPQSSTSGLVSTLVGLGYLAYRPGTREVMPTARVALLGNWINRDLADGRIRQMMHDLSEATGETIIVATPVRLHARYLMVVPATKPMRLHIPAGTTRPIAESGMGLLFLAQLDDEAVDRLADEIDDEKRRDGAPPLDRERLRRELREVRETGVSTSANRVFHGAGVVSVALPTVDGRTTLGLGIGGLSDTVIAEKDRFVSLMRAAISRHLGPNRSAGQPPPKP